MVSSPQYTAKSVSPGSLAKYRYFGSGQVDIKIKSPFAPKKEENKTEGKFKVS